MSSDGVVTVEALLQEYRDIFRIKLGPDPPAKVEPLRIQMRANCKPFRSTQRRYAAPQRDFIASIIKHLTKINCS